MFLTDTSRPFARAASVTIGITLTTSLLIGPSACAGDGNDEPVIEMVTRLVAKDTYDEFVVAHGAYRAVLQDRPSVGDSRLTSSFYSSTASDVPNERIAIVELTVFDSEAAYRDARTAASVAGALARLAETSTVEADVLVRQPDGSTDLDDFNGAALEIAVREVQPDNRADYDRAQGAFLEELTAIPGTKTVEFEMVDNGSLTAGYSTYATQQALQDTLDFYSEAQVAQNFFASFTLLSSQFGSQVTGLDAIHAQVAEPGTHLCPTERNAPRCDLYAAVVETATAR